MARRVNVTHPPPCMYPCSWVVVASMLCACGDSCACTGCDARNLSSVLHCTVADGSSIWWSVVLCLCVSDGKYGSKKRGRGRGAKKQPAAKRAGKKGRKHDSDSEEYVAAAPSRASTLPRRISARSLSRSRSGAAGATPVAEGAWRWTASPCGCGERNCCSCVAVAQKIFCVDVADPSAWVSR